MQSLEGACEEGERTFKKIKISRSSLPLLQSQDSFEAKPSPSTSCISTKFLELYKEESAKDSNESKPGLRRSSLLLEKLLARERLNTLILKLYAGNKGYSVAFRINSRCGESSSNMGGNDSVIGGIGGDHFIGSGSGNGGIFSGSLYNTTTSNLDDTANMIETKTWPYEVEKLLTYLDNEELPPHLIKLIESRYSFLFYNGRIIAEVRDYRQAYPHFKCHIHYILLRPTQKSLLTDLNNIVSERLDWGKDECQQFESQILLANKPHLCLDPNNIVSVENSRIQHNRQLLNTYRLRRAAKKYSRVTVNRNRKLDQLTHRHGMELYDFLTKTRTKPKTGFVNRKINNNDLLQPIPVPNLDPPPISPPSQGVFIKEFKVYPRPKDTTDCLPQLVEEYVLETDMPSKEKEKKRVYHIKLSILQRPSNCEYLGELYLDRDHKTNERNGVACRFSLGTRSNANRYIHQFTEIFTESGRKSVRIRYGLNPSQKEKAPVTQAQHQTQSQTPNSANNSSQSNNITQQHITQLPQSLQTPQLVNGAIQSRISLMQQQNQNIQNVSSVPLLQSHLQSATQLKQLQPATQQEIEINALATKLMNSAQQYQANAKQQQQQQQQKLVSSRNNAAILNLLNSSPASNVNSDASEAVVNAINNSTLLPQQVQTINQKLLARKMTLSNVTNARVLNHANLIAVNNNRINIVDQQQQQQQQTITLTSVNSGGPYTSYTTLPVKQQQLLTNNTDITTNKSALSALLVGTPAADHPDIIGPNTNSLLLKKLAGSSLQNSQFIKSSSGGQQYIVQSPTKSMTSSPLSSPPSQQQQPLQPQQQQQQQQQTSTTNTTINVQGLNFAQLQSIPGLQVQLSSLSAGNLQTHPTSLLVSLPVTTSTTTANTITQSSGGSGSGSAYVNSIGVGGPTVVLANAGTSNIAQLVTSGVKNLAQHGIRTTVPTATLSQGNQSFQLITPLQRPRIQQTTSSGGIQQQQQQQQQNRIQRNPITIKMAPPNANAATVSHLQKQQLQQYQQLCLNQQQKNLSGKLRRRTNASDTQ